MTRRIAAGTETTDAVDADGIPQWAHDPQHGFHHGDTKQTFFAMGCELKGFNLPQFDLWLSALGDCGAKTELIERRGLAMSAITQNRTDAALRHLEWMQSRRREIQREDHLLPLARTGKKVRKPFEDQNKKTHLTAQQWRDDWQNRANKIWAKPQHATKSKKAVAELIALAGENPDTIRKAITKQKQK